MRGQIIRKRGACWEVTGGSVSFRHSTWRLLWGSGFVLGACGGPESLVWIVKVLTLLKVRMLISFACFLPDTTAIRRESFFLDLAFVVSVALVPFLFPFSLAPSLASFACFLPITNTIVQSRSFCWNLASVALLTLLVPFSLAPSLLSFVWFLPVTTAIVQLWSFCWDLACFGSFLFGWKFLFKVLQLQLWVVRDWLAFLWRLLMLLALLRTIRLEALVIPLSAFAPRGRWLSQGLSLAGLLAQVLSISQGLWLTGESAKVLSISHQGLRLKGCRPFLSASEELRLIGCSHCCPSHCRSKISSSAS